MSRSRGRSRLLATMVLASAVGLAGCLSQPDTAELISKPVIVTKRDPNASFTSFTTFAMTDSIPVVSLSSVDAGVTATTADPAIANPTLDEISAQLSSRGYQRVARTEGPDLGVAVTAVTKLNVSISYGGWWGQPVGGTPSYWGYSGIYAAGLNYSTVAWQSGTLIIELFDLRAARDEARRASVSPSVASPTPTSTSTIPVVWAAIIHAVLGAAGASLQAPPIDSIRQAFIQSPYLARPPTIQELQ